VAKPVEVVAGLQGKPQFRALSTELAEPQRHFGRHGRARGEDGVKSLPRDAREVRDLGARPLPRPGKISSGNSSPGCSGGSPVASLGSIVNGILQNLWRCG
jgi:hypothetical protein